MAKRSFSFLNQTFTAQNYTTALTSATYAALKGGSTTQLIDILEVLLSGMATASTVSALQLCRVSTVATSGAETALASPNSDGPMHPSTAALAAPPVSFVAAGTAGPQASAVTADARLNLAFNLFGGVVRWQAGPTQQFSMLGNTADLGEVVVFNGGQAGGSSGAANGHVIYEPY